MIQYHFSLSVIQKDLLSIIKMPCWTDLIVKDLCWFTASSLRMQLYCSPHSHSRLRALISSQVILTASFWVGVFSPHSRTPSLTTYYTCTLFLSITFFHTLFFLNLLISLGFHSFYISYSTKQGIFITLYIVIFRSRVSISIFPARICPRTLFWNRGGKLDK